MVRRRTPSSRLHVHCESCHSRRCRAPVEIGISCVMISCRTMCGATFHVCKEEEHTLLCPNEMVPCLNAHYGCPFTMCRSRLSKHLETCPASVVSCSMEWNRWPVEGMHEAFYENVLKESYVDEPLDYAMALRDQTHLFHSLKMKAVFPELTERVEEPEDEPPPLAELEGAVGGVSVGLETEYGAVGGAGVDSLPPGATPEHAFEEEEGALTQEQREALARGSEVDTTNYNAWERMFSMEMGGCKQTIKALGQHPMDGHGQVNNLETLQEEPEVNGNDQSNEPRPQYLNDLYNMDEHKYLVASCFYACQTAANKKLIYQYKKPTEIKTTRAFTIPTSFSARSSRVRNPSHMKKLSKAVDTSDLGVDMDNLPMWDEVQATLLCCLEKERRGHLIAEPKSFDALFIDIGTQTYDFMSAPFQHTASLATITAEREPKFHVQIETESVTGKHNKCSSAFNFLCSHLFRRDEYAPHFQNVHADIQSNVSGWMEQRCPLAYLGCTFIQRRLQPAPQQAIVCYNKDLSTFSLRPEMPATLYESVKTMTTECKLAHKEDCLSNLPFEVLVHMAGFLDSFSLSQLALVSKYMRDVSSTLLHDRGIVSLKWEKKTYSHGGYCWRSRKMVWQFSNCFSKVDCWRFGNCPPISEHLKVCPYYEHEAKTDRVPLTGIYDAEEGVDRTESLVSMFSRKK